MDESIDECNVLNNTVEDTIYDPDGPPTHYKPSQEVYINTSTSKKSNISTCSEQSSSYMSSPHIISNNASDKPKEHSAFRAISKCVPPPRLSTTRRGENDNSVYSWPTQESADLNQKLSDKYGGDTVPLNRKADYVDKEYIDKKLLKYPNDATLIKWRNVMKEDNDIRLALWRRTGINL